MLPVGYHTLSAHSTTSPDKRFPAGVAVFERVCRLTRWRCSIARPGPAGTGSKRNSSKENVDEKDSKPDHGETLCGGPGGHPLVHGRSECPAETDNHIHSVRHPSWGIPWTCIPRDPCIHEQQCSRRCAHEAGQLLGSYRHRLSRPSARLQRVRTRRCPKHSLHRRRRPATRGTAHSEV